jgi:hypothetical protein
VRAVALAIACEIHPLNNLRVLQYLKGPLAQPPDISDGEPVQLLSNGKLNANENSE